VLLEQKQAQDELRGFLKGVTDTYLATGLQRQDMESAITKANSTLMDLMKNFMTPDTFTKVGSNIESYPADIEQIASMVNSAFRVVPQDDLDRPQVRFYIYYTEANLFRDEVKVNNWINYLKELKNENPFLASLFKLQNKRDESRQGKAFKSLKKQLKDNENLIHMVPDIVLVGDLKDANILEHLAGQIPEEMGATHGLILTAAIGLAAALREDVPDEVKQPYLKYLKDSLGFYFEEDPTNNRLIISFNIRSLIENLVTLQKAEEAIRVAA